MTRFTQGLILTEDRRFFQHWGVDLLSILRALLTNINEKRYSQGGSTITQQLARTLYLHNRKTISRKILELFLAIYLEMRYTKDEILEMYLSSIYMGQDRKGKIIKGVYKAAKYYFHKPLSNLSLSEEAALIAAIKGPNLYKVKSSMGLARRVMVLSIMLHNRVITKEEFLEYSTQNIPN